MATSKSKHKRTGGEARPKCFDFITHFKQLENTGLITRQHDNKNERTVLVSLTVRGSEIQAQISQVQQHVSCETDLTELEYIELRERLTYLMDNLKAHVKGPHAWLAKLPSDS